MIKKFYYWFHNKFSRPEERGEYSSGYWLNIVRMNALDLCRFRRGRLLEVGCGEGLFLNKLAQQNKNLEIFGLDIWRVSILKAKDRFQENKIKKINLIQADSYNITFRDNSFDTVVCINVLYNLPSEEIFYMSLKEMTRVCKIGGRVIFEIRNRQNPFLCLKYKFAGFYDETVKKHPLRTYRLDKVILFLESMNMEIVKRINIGFPYNKFPPIFIIEAEKKIN